jgi:uncharacterized coiled-coil protein SlyX
MAEIKDRVNTLEHALGSFIIQTEKAITSLSNEMKQLNKEMKDFKDEMKDFKDEMKYENRRMNRRWGEISNKLGSIAEDIAAPGLYGIIKRYFLKELDKRMDTLYIRNAKDKKLVREFDVIAVTEELFFVCEIKSTPRSDYIKDFVDLVSSDKIYEYFPEHKDKTLVPVFSSFDLPEDVVRYLSKHKILAMAMGEDHIDIVNKDILSHWIS